VLLTGLSILLQACSQFLYCLCSCPQHEVIGSGALERDIALDMPDNHHLTEMAESPDLLPLPAVLPLAPTPLLLTPPVPFVNSSSSASNHSPAQLATRHHTVRNANEQNFHADLESPDFGSQTPPSLQGVASLELKNLDADAHDVSAADLSAVDYFGVSSLNQSKELQLPVHEVMRRLRNYQQPLTLCWESDAQRLERLRAYEELAGKRPMNSDIFGKLLASYSCTCFCVQRQGKATATATTARW